jgi:diguanylate cyclase (GGDEF)-like protein
MNRYSIISCDWSARIQEVIFSSFELESIRPGKNLFDVFNCDTCEKLNSFLRELKSDKYAYGWEMNIDINNCIYAIDVSGAIIDDILIITLGEKGTKVLKYYEDMLRISNVQANKIRELEKQIADNYRTENNKHLDSITKLNNELINTRRELEKKNTQLNLLNDELKRISVTDELTSLFNRRHFFDIIENEIKKAQRLEYSLSLLSIDINSFKRVNDTYGHNEGDKLLKDLAHILQSNTRDGLDYAFRFGGDEFLLLLGDCNEKEALEVGLRVDKEFSSYTEIASLAYGAVELRLNTDDIEKMIQEADMKMYSHKKESKIKNI